MTSCEATASICMLQTAGARCVAGSACTLLLPYSLVTHYVSRAPGQLGSKQTTSCTTQEGSKPRPGQQQEDRPHLNLAQSTWALGMTMLTVAALLACRAAFTLSCTSCWAATRFSTASNLPSGPPLLQQCNWASCLVQRPWLPFRVLLALSATNKAAHLTPDHGVWRAGSVLCRAS